MIIEFSVADAHDMARRLAQAERLRPPDVREGPAALPDWRVGELEPIDTQESRWLGLFVVLFAVALTVRFLL